MSIRDARKTLENEVLAGAAKASLAAIAVLLILSLVFYKERMLFIDAPHILFRIVNDGKLQITEHRYGSFITQMVPLVAAKLQLPIKSVLLLYSASFYLFYLGCGCLLVYRYKQYGMAVLFGLYLTLFASDTFYWPNNEVHQGIAWLLLAFSIYLQQERQKANLLFSLTTFTAVFFLAIWTHPLVMLVAGYLFVFFILAGITPVNNKYRLVGNTIVLATLCIIKFYYGMHHGYDSGKIETVTQFNAGQLLHIFSSPQFKSLARGCITNYWLFAIISATGLAILLGQKRYKLLLLTAAAAMGYVLLICITYWNAQSGRFYIESEYMPLSIICSTPFVFYGLPMLNKKTAVLLLLTLFAVRTCYIVNSASFFSDRIATIEQIERKMKAKGLAKVIIADAGKATDSTTIMNWGAPVESMLYSKLSGDVPQLTYIFLDTQQVKDFNTYSKDTLLGSFEKRGAAQLNSRYFSIDTNSPYQVISYKSL